MTVYILLAPVAGAIVPPEKRKTVLISLDAVRACVVLILPFVTEIWQIYLLLAVLQSVSAGFTPLFQSLGSVLNQAIQTHRHALRQTRQVLPLVRSPRLRFRLVGVIENRP